MTTIGELYYKAGKAIAKGIGKFGFLARQDDESTFTASVSSVRELVVTTSQALASIYRQIRKGFVTFNTQIEALEWNMLPFLCEYNG